MKRSWCKITNVFQIQPYRWKDRKAQHFRPRIHCPTRWSRVSEQNCYELALLLLGFGVLIRSGGFLYNASIVFYFPRNLTLFLKLFVMTSWVRWSSTPWMQEPKNWVEVHQCWQSLENALPAMSIQTIKVTVSDVFLNLCCLKSFNIGFHIWLIFQDLFFATLYLVWLINTSRAGPTGTLLLGVFFGILRENQLWML